MALRQILVMISRSGQCLDKQKVVVLGVNLPTREIVTRAAPLYAVLWRNGCCLNRLDGCAEQWYVVVTMNTTTLIIIIVVLVLLFGGGGFYYSRRR